MKKLNRKHKKESKKERERINRNGKRRKKLKWARPYTGCAACRTNRLIGI
jgi:hypothetical protein